MVIKDMFSVNFTFLIIESIMIEKIKSEFQKNGKSEIAKQQASYLKNKFEFYGLKSPERKTIQRPFLVKQNLPEKDQAFKIISELWKEPQRELHYFAIELLLKYKKVFEKSDLEFIEELIQKNSWWDSVDSLAPNAVGAYFQKYPEQRSEIIDRWIESGNIWLKRTAILFQLKYREKTDKKLLVYIIDKLKEEKEFFIRKAIGWILREVSKREPEWVRSFVEETDLQPLSRKEALKFIEKKGL